VCVWYCWNTLRSSTNMRNSYSHFIGSSVACFSNCDVSWHVTNTSRCINFRDSVLGFAYWCLCYYKTNQRDLWHNLTVSWVKCDPKLILCHLHNSYTTCSCLHHYSLTNLSNASARFNTIAVPAVVYFYSSLASVWSINTTNVGAYSNDVKLWIRGGTVTNYNFSQLTFWV
jgi:hypothetical protein